MIICQRCGQNYSEVEGRKVRTFAFEGWGWFGLPVVQNYCGRCVKFHKVFWIGVALVLVLIVVFGLILSLSS